MDQAPITAVRRRSPVLALALVLATLLTAAWAWRDWGALSHFRLPDNDDMMRLAEVRDWIGGQSFWDLTQHRLGPPGGASMHWSRIADLGPAAIIVALDPLLGRTGAELAMLVLYQGVLFLAALLIGAKIAEWLAPRAAPIAVLVLALSFPASSLFVPGRIDHHALQIVLILWFVERLVARPDARSGAAMGLAAAISLAVGLETLPLLLAGMGALFVRWVTDASPAPFALSLSKRRTSFRRSTQKQDGASTSPARTVGRVFADPQLLAFAATLGGVTLLFLATIRPMIWPAQWCDGFTPASTDATLTASAWFAAIALLPFKSWKARLGAGAGLGVLALPLVLHTSSVCLTGPYGAMDPLLMHLWMSRVGEALSLFQQDSVGVAVSYGALGLVGAAALGWILADGAWRSAKWRGFAIVYGLGVLLTLAQIRATYVVSALAAVPLAVAIQRVRARTASPLLRIGAWVLAAGMTWNLAGLWLDQSFAPHVVAAKLRMGACTGAAQVDALAALPAGRVIAPLDSASYIIGGTHHASVAAAYHRNNPGNLAMYHFFLGSPAEARRIARDWRADYVVMCPDSFGELGPGVVGDSHRLVGAIRAGTQPAWLQPLARTSDGPLIFRIRPGL